jgi:two-component system response regulator DevR
MDLKMTIKVLILDDHELVRTGIKSLLEAEPEIVVVTEASNASEALIRTNLYQPDVAILDIRLGQGELDGVEVCREIRSRFPHVACLMLTAYADDRAMASAILAGAAGYVLKDIKGSRLVESVKQIAQGKVLIPRDASSRVINLLNGENDQDKLLATLSKREREMLELIEKGLTNREIAQTMFLAEKTVKNYISHLLVKMGMTNRTQVAVYAAKKMKPES